MASGSFIANQSSYRNANVGRVFAGAGIGRTMSSDEVRATLTSGSKASYHEPAGYSPNWSSSRSSTAPSNHWPAGEHNPGSRLATRISDPGATSMTAKRSSSQSQQRDSPRARPYMQYMPYPPRPWGAQPSNRAPGADDGAAGTAIIVDSQSTPGLSSATRPYPDSSLESLEERSDMHMGAAGPTYDWLPPYARQVHPGPHQ